MSIEIKYIDYFVNVTHRAALASSYFVGKKDKISADKAATDSMRSELNKIDMNGKIVIGEGEMDQAPMLCQGRLRPQDNSQVFSEHFLYCCRR